MDQWQEFRAAYRKGEQYRAFGPEDRARLESFIPDWLLELWEADGWAGYRGGLFWTVDPQEFEPLVDLWKPPEGPAFPVARTAFGTLYLLQPFIEGSARGLSVVEINPHTGHFSVVGSEAEIFLTEIPVDPGYIKNVFWEPRVKRAVKDVGPLQWDEMYAFEPALALGGSGEPETVRRVKLFDHHLLLSQLVELKFVKY